MDNEYYLDRDAIIRTAREADVITVRFVTVPMRLLVDFRFSDADPPMVKLVPPAANANERFKSLKQLRPRFKLPRRISAIWWPRYVRTMRETGVWDAIVQRIAGSGFPEMTDACEALFEELARMERLEIVNAINGEGYRTLWPAQRR